MFITYNKSFANSLGTAALGAKFQLDAKGKPLSGEEDDTKFYYIDLFLNPPAAATVREVTYLLDENTYWEPERTSKDASKQFQQTITSYGDFMVRVEVKVADAKLIQQALLTDMLADHYGESPAKPVADAIEYLRQN